MKTPRKRTRTVHLDYLSIADVDGDTLVLLRQDYSGSVLQTRRVVIDLNDNMVEELATKLWEWHRREVKRQNDVATVLRGGV